MIKVVQCQCGAKVKFDTEEVTIYEFENYILTGLIICPACKQFVEVSRVDRSADYIDKEDKISEN